MSISLPIQFVQKISGSHQTLVNQYISTYTPILEDNKLTFFPDFTDHGINHINQVLQTAANLIPEKSYEFLSSGDISAIIISVILHDVGMHIDVSGLKKILSDSFDTHRVQYFNSRTWNQEWEDFFYEVKRFNEEQMINIFGSSTVVIKEPDLEELDSYTVRIYGEFLRRHHHRLAHEIALGGFPTKINEDNLRIGEGNIPNKVINLYGLIARSHGMNLRDTFEYLKNQHDEMWCIPFDIKVIYLMVVLRISDYIQIQSDRASEILIRTKLFSSPISSQEWEKHNSIEHISVKNADPERIYVQANPSNSKTYLELNRLFKSIQKEFDLSWAILGEVYGRNDELNKLKIKYRRIVSNIDNKEKFANEVDYLPEKVRFDADPELLKLLIGPLYGDDAKYGIRELLQNSVDAVKERNHISGEIENPIEISIENNDSRDDSFTLIIKDQGIGMTSDTLIIFFFRAGASYRESMVWKKNFIQDDIIQVEKTGRFGVGALAVFLLGNEFELTTRNINDNKGYKCSASLNSTQIELIKCDADIGTTIKINLKDDVNKIILRHSQEHSTLKIEDANFYIYQLEQIMLDWFSWYTMDKPRIQYKFPNEDIRKIFRLPIIECSSNPDIPLNGWYNFQPQNFRSVHWTSRSENSDSFFYERDNGLLLCNGFPISRGYSIEKFPWGNPVVSVFDGAAKMPISLSRDHIQNDRLPFEKELVENVCETIINQLIKTNFQRVGSYWVPEENILNFQNQIDLSHFILIKNNHFTILESSVIKEKNITQFYRLWLKSQNPEQIFDNESYYISNNLVRDTNQFYKAVLEENRFKNIPLKNWFSIGMESTMNILESYNFIPNGKLQFMLEKNRLSKSFKYLGTNFFNDNWSYVVDFRSDNYIDDVNGTQNEKEIQSIFQKRKRLSEKVVFDINSAKLRFDDFHFIKQVVIDTKRSPLYFDTFIKILKEKVGEDCMIPINEDRFVL